MAARTALAQYIIDRLAERRETADEFAQRIGVNSSGLYKLLRGEYAEPRQSTLDKIAAGLGMTPADLLIAIGKGSSTADPEELEFVAILRQVPSEKRSAARDMLRGLAIQPVNKGAMNRPAPRSTSPRSGRRHALDTHASTLDDSADQGGLSTVSRALKGAFAFALSPFRQPIDQTIWWPSADAAIVA